MQTWMQGTYRKISDRVKVPLEVAWLPETFHDWSILDVLVNHPGTQHGVERRQRGQKEIARVEWPPRPPHQGH